MQINGKILEISEPQNISATFRKREFVIEYVERQYPEFIKFEAIQEKCDLLDAYKAGDDVAVDFNLKGRKWTNPEGEVKYFNSLQAWRIGPAQQGGEPNQQKAPYQQAPAPAPYQQAPAPAPVPARRYILHFD